MSMNNIVFVLSDQFSAFYNRLEVIEFRLVSFDIQNIYYDTCVSQGIYLYLDKRL